MSQVVLNDLKRQYLELEEDLKAAVDRVLGGGWYVHGPEHDAFEREFAVAQGASHCVAVGNGTDALEIGLAALGCGPGTEVITVANAGFYTSAAALKLGATPVYVDVDPHRLLMDPDLVQDAITDRTAAVVVTHLYGQLAPVERVVEIAAAHGVPVLEDCAQAISASRGGRTAGTFGAVGTFSFYPTKNLGALGDGGACVTGQPELADRMRALRQYGWTRKYEVSVSGGRNSRLDELQAAVLRVKLPHVPRWNERRRSIVGAYQEALRASAGLRLVSSTGEDDVAHLCVGLASDRPGVMSSLSAAGIATAVHYPVPDHLQAVAQGSPARRDLTETERSQAQIVTLPCFPELTGQEVERVCHALAAL